MAGNALLNDPLDGLRSLSTAEIWPLEVAKAEEAPRRLEAGFYASEGYQALAAMRHSGFEILDVGTLASILWFGPFARKYVQDPGHGCPFLTSSTMMEARPKAEKLVSIKHTSLLDRLRIHEDYILVSCSGTIGNTVLCTKDVDGWACSQDAIRVIARDDSYLGSIYCYLQSPLGQFLIKKNQTGSVVRHIYEADVSSLPIPRLPKRLRLELTDLVKKASALRVEANRLLDEAEEMVQVQLGLPDIEEFLAARDVPEDHGAAVFTVPVRGRVSGLGKFGRCRLDATAHDPAAVKLRRYILDNEAGLLLGELLEGVRRSSLRKRVFVEDHDYGVPLLGGKQLMQLRPSELRYLSKVHTKSLKSEKLQDGWVVVTCGGTVGRVLLVHKNYDNWVISEDVMRLVTCVGTVYPGFLYAFLASEYGQLQLLQLAYGSVQKKLRDFHFQDLAICLPGDKGESIHSLVVQGFDMRADAMDSENHAFDLFLSAINQGRPKTESEWGTAY